MGRSTRIAVWCLACGCLAASLVGPGSIATLVFFAAACGVARSHVSLCGDRRLYAHVLPVLCAAGSLPLLPVNVGVAWVLAGLVLAPRRTRPKPSAMLVSLAGLLGAGAFGALTLGQYSIYASTDASLTGSLAALANYAVFPLAAILFCRWAYRDAEGAEQLAISASATLCLYVIVAVQFGRQSGPVESTGFSAQYSLLGRNLYVNRTYIGPMLAAVAAASLAVAIRRPGIIWVAISLGAAGGALVMLILVGSRTALLLLPPATFVVLLANVPGLSPRLRTGIAVGMLLSAVCWLATVADPRAGKGLDQLLGYSAGREKAGLSAATRTRRWGQAWDFVVTSPYGIGWTTRIPNVRAVKADRTLPANPHNDVLAFCISFGWLGGIGYAVLLAWVAASLVRTSLGAPSAHSAVSLGALIPFVGGSLTDHMTASPDLFVLVWLVLAVGLSQDVQRRRSGRRARSAFVPALPYGGTAGRLHTGAPGGRASATESDDGGRTAA